MLIAFDMDGTLVDSREDLALSVNLTRKSYGLPELDLHTVVSYVGNGAKKLISRAFSGTDIDVEQAAERMRKYYSEHLWDKTYLYDQVKEGVETLASSGCRLMVFTNKNTEPAEAILKHFGLSDYFFMVVGGDGDYPLKPSPDALLAAKEKSGEKQLIMLGDNYTDLAAGRGAGALRVMAKWGFGNARDEQYDFAADNFNEFVQWVKGLPAG